MPNLQIAPKLAIVNSENQFPLTFHTKQADGSFRASTTVSNTADRIVLGGFAQLTKSALISAVGAKGVAPVLHQQRITIAPIADVAAAVGGQATILIQLKSNNLQSEFEGPYASYKRGVPLLVEVRAGETAQSLAQQIKDNIDRNTETAQQFITASEVITEMGDTDNNATTPDAPTGSYSVIISTSYEGVEISTKVEPDNTFKGKVTITSAVEVQGYEGRGSYRQLSAVRLQTPARVYPFSGDTEELPVKGDRYSSYLVTFHVDRPDLAGGATINQSVGGDFQLHLFINETRAAGLITNLTGWLNTNAPTKLQYTATTAAAALAQPEATSTTIA